LHLIGGCLAVSLLMPTDQAGPQAAGLSTERAHPVSFQAYAPDLEARHLIDFIDLGAFPVFGQRDHEASIDGSFQAGIDKAFHALGRLKAVDQRSALGSASLWMQDLAFMPCADRLTGSILRGHALQQPSLGSALSWLTSETGVEPPFCDSAFPAEQVLSAALPYDIAHPGADGGPSTDDLLRFSLGGGDDGWAVRQRLNVLEGGADMSLRAAKQPLRRLASLPRQGGNRLITPAALTHGSADTSSAARPIGPLASQPVSPRPAIGLPILPKSQRQRPPSTSGMAVHPGVAREIYALAVQEPPSLVLRDAVQEKREKALVFDNDWILANRLKVPLGRLSFSRQAENANGGVIALVPFLDTGTVWNTETVTYPIASDPFGIGAGIGWQITDATDVRLGIDIPVGGDETEGADDSSELGFQFRLATTFGD
jgi:hypothetical protein